MAKTNKNGYKYDLDHIPPIFYVPEMLPGEIFTLLPERAAEGVLPYYAISTYGRIWHIYENKFMSTAWDGGGYRIAVLRTNRNGRPRTYRVHRMMMLTFRYDEYLRMQEENPNCHIVVDHINNNKNSNYIDFPGYGDNLQWVTQSKNMKMAHEDGIKVAATGERSGNAVHTDAEVEEICRMISIGNLTNRQVAEICDVPLYFVENIRYRGAWKHISDKYPGVRADKYK